MSLRCGPLANSIRSRTFGETDTTNGMINASVDVKKPSVTPQKLVRRRSLNCCGKLEAHPLVSDQAEASRKRDGLQVHVLRDVAENAISCCQRNEHLPARVRADPNRSSLKLYSNERLSHERAKHIPAPWDLGLSGTLSRQPVGNLREICPKL